MSDCLFPYPGGKANYSDWIIQHFPQHECYVEAFGGGAGVLINKPESAVEVYNDVNEDLVQFFRVLRNRPNELQTFLERMPYSRSEYERVATEWYGENHRPDDELTRAAWFFFLQQAGFSGKLEKSGFSIDNTQKGNRARAYKNNVESVSSFADRFKGVTIECLDYRELVDRYDSSKTLFYFDPPYLEVGDGYYNHEHDFDHRAFVELLNDTEGDWIVSYNELPDGLEGYAVATRETRYSMSSQKHTYNTERLVMNYNYIDEPMFRQTQQQGLEMY